MFRVLYDNNYWKIFLIYNILLNTAYIEYDYCTNLDTAYKDMIMGYKIPYLFTRISSRARIKSTTDLTKGKLPLNLYTKLVCEPWI